MVERFSASYASITRIFLGPFEVPGFKKRYILEFNTQFMLYCVKLQLFVFWGNFLRGQNQPHIGFTSLKSRINLFFKPKHLKRSLRYTVFNMQVASVGMTTLEIRFSQDWSITFYIYQIYSEMNKWNFHCRIYLLLSQLGLEYLKQTKKLQTVN